MLPLAHWPRTIMATMAMVTAMVTATATAMLIATTATAKETSVPRRHLRRRPPAPAYRLRKHHRRLSAPAL
jgi:hypothetical protein